MILLGFVINLLITALVIFLAAKWMKGVQVNGYGSAICVGLMLALLNFCASWLFELIGLPRMSTGLITFVVNMCINAGLILLADKFMDSFKVDGFKNAFILALILAFTSAFIGGVF
ncbi:MAG: phage holin family protein [Paludibacteraceae bacterium]|nr:phage holin family protein [Paludibacteraceae bacterium]MBR1786262.1 phage holin family protein [Paludibacteraceae bacterium]